MFRFVPARSRTILVGTENLMVERFHSGYYKNRSNVKSQEPLSISLVEIELIIEIAPTRSLVIENSRED